MNANNGQRLPRWFLDRVEVAEALAEKIGVVLVANVQGLTTPADDYEGDSIITEFLSNKELDHLIESFEKAGIYCEPVLDEEGFIQWLNTGRSTFPRPYPFVYNLAQNGTGPARLSLIPGLCRLHHIPLIDSGAYAVAVARHKFHVTTLLRQFGLSVARSWWFTDHGWWPEAPRAGLRLIAKPTYESASIGIHKDSVFEMDASTVERLAQHVETYRQPLTVQEFIRGFEVEVPVFQPNEPRTIMAVGLALDGRRNLDDSFLVYDEVALDQYTFYNFADERPTNAEEAMRAAEAAFRSLGLSGVGRVDFRVPSNGSSVIIEVACKPHLTRHSSFMHAINDAGGSHADLLKFIVGSAAERHGIRV